jgi:hypothetical protein
MHLSANQISKWRRCNRAWGFEYIDGIVPPPSPKQAFGSDVHAELERWLKLGRIPNDTPAGRVAAQGLHFLPTPRSGLKIEYGFDMPWIGDVTLTGFIDCLCLDGVDPCDKNKWRGSGRPLIIDHKTTSALRYTKTEAELINDPQAILYAVYTMITFDEPVVDVRWVYYAASNSEGKPRKPSGCRSVEVAFSVGNSEFLHRVEELLRDSEKMIRALRDKPSAISLAPDPHACGTYGGCPHCERCALSDGEKLDAYFLKK